MSVNKPGAAGPPHVTEFEAAAAAAVAPTVLAAVFAEGVAEALKVCFQLLTLFPSILLSGYR